MNYLVTLRNRDKTATMVVNLPANYDFCHDIHLPSATAHFMPLKLKCKEQVPSGFHDCCWMLRESEIEATKVIAISKLEVHKFSIQDVKRIYDTMLCTIFWPEISRDTQAEILSAFNVTELMEYLHSLDIHGFYSNKLEMVEKIRDYFKEVK